MRKLHFWKISHQFTVISTAKTNEFWRISIVIIQYSARYLPISAPPHYIQGHHIRMPHYRSTCHSYHCHTQFCKILGTCKRKCTIQKLFRTELRTPSMCNTMRMESKSSSCWAISIDEIAMLSKVTNLSEYDFKWAVRAFIHLKNVKSVKCLLLCFRD